MAAIVSQIPLMNKQCPSCGLINFKAALACSRCGADVREVEAVSSERRAVSRRRKYLRRLMYTPLLIAVLLLVFYVSLRITAEALTAEQQATFDRANDILEQRGFASEAFMLRHFTTLRATDNWFNRYLGHADAYAATNFPFQVLTLYPEFFEATQDDTERAIVLLHEAQHLYGASEEKAYEYVWRRRRVMFWTKEKYADTKVWHNVVEATRQYAPRVFVCGLEQNQDCTE